MELGSRLADGVDELAGRPAQAAGRDAVVTEEPGDATFELGLVAGIGDAPVDVGLTAAAGLAEPLGVWACGPEL